MCFMRDQKEDLPQNEAPVGKVTEQLCNMNINKLFEFGQASSQDFYRN